MSSRSDINKGISLPAYDHLDDEDRIKFQRLVEKTRNKEHIKTIEWIERNKGNDGFVKSLSHNKYVEHVTYIVNRHSKLKKEISDLFTEQELDNVENGKLKTMAYAEMFTGTMNHGFIYEEIPAIVLTARDALEDFIDEDKDLFQIVKLEECVVNTFIECFYDFDVANLFREIKCSENVLDILTAFTSLPFCNDDDFIEKCIKSPDFLSAPHGLRQALFIIEELQPYFKKNWKCLNSQIEQDEYDSSDGDSDVASWTSYCSEYVDLTFDDLDKYNVYMMIKNK